MGEHRLRGVSKPKLTMYVHPAVAQLECPSCLDVVDGLRKPLGHRLMKERQKAR
jgi:hypothetical protein